MADRFSSKAVLEVGVWTWSLFTMLTPMAARSGIWPLLLARFLTGIGEGICITYSRHTALEASLRAELLLLQDQQGMSAQ